MPGADAWQFLGRALGANPTPMSFAEVYTVLILNFIVASDNIASMMASALVDLKISPLAFLLSINLLIWCCSGRACLAISARAAISPICDGIAGFGGSRPCFCCQKIHLF